jgi:hypothetical protein
MEFRLTRIHFETHGESRFDLEGTVWYQVDDRRHLPSRLS